MQKYQYDFSVIIGRFQPFHLGHLRNLLEALKVSQQVVVILGSSDSPRTYENPFTTVERIEYITKCIPIELRSRVKFNGIPDTLYQDMAWVENVTTAVTSVVRDYYPGNVEDAKVVVIAHNKDEATSTYLKMLPWKILDVGVYMKEDHGDTPLSATKIRELLFTDYLGYAASVVPSEMYDWLKQFIFTEDYQILKEEYNFDSKYLPDAHEKMVKGVYPTNFYTADAVVFQTGRVLLVKRKFASGRGLWALPGGHVGAGENSFEAALRELKEETAIKVPEKVLIGSLKGEKVFDHPKRSLRGKTTSSNCRTVTVAYCFKLADGEDLPRVKASDDAEEAWWFTLAEINQMRHQIFEDHYSIIQYYVAKI